MTKKNFDEQKKRNFVIIIKVSSAVVFDINIHVLANITFIGKIPQKYHKSQKLTKFTLN